MNIESGKRFGRLTAIGPSSDIEKWRFLCDCGNTKSISHYSVRTGNTKSCGCLSSETTSKRNIAQAKHGKYKSTTYKSWQSMRTRCLNPKSDHFNDYGAKGITVCERWNKFENFLADMGERPPGTTIDRKDNAKGYEPGNCRWATMREQENNKRNNIVIEAEGKSQTLMQWSREKGIYYHTLLKRLQYGWTVERALSQPVYNRKTKCLTVLQPHSST